MVHNEIYIDVQSRIARVHGRRRGIRRMRDRQR
jgi:hypothetical protein